MGKYLDDSGLAYLWGKIKDYADNAAASGGTPYSAGTGLTLSNHEFNHSNSVTAGTAGTSSATSGSTLAVPYVTYDSEGHVTASGTHTHTINGFISDSTSQTANTVLAAPNGSAGSPTFRSLVAADIPNLAASKITSGTLALARGGTASDNSAAAINKVFAGPSSGSAGNASFRSLVAADLPTVTIAKGGTGATDRLNALKNLTNQAVATPTYVLGITTSWATGGYTTIAQLTSTLGIACTRLWNGTLSSSGKFTFTYGGYNAYIVMGKPSGGSFISVIIPAGTIGTSDSQWQLADDSCYISFKIKYSSTTGTVTYVGKTSGSNGQINYVYGIK